MKVKHFFLSVCLILFFAAEVLAQRSCFIVVDPATGQEGEYQGCVPFTVNVKKCNNSTSVDSSFYFFFPATLIDSTITRAFSVIPTDSFSSVKTTQTYQKTGTYYIAMYSNTDNADSTFTVKKITVFDPSSQPAFTWKTCGKELQIQFTDTVFTKYEFNPGNGIPPIQVSSKTFAYDYASTVGSPFSFSIKGVLPRTCNKELVGDTVSVYSAARAPDPIILKAAGTDTLSYTASVAVRADEDYAFQKAVPGGSFSGLLSVGRSDKDNASLSVNILLPAGKKTQGGQIRSVTRKRCETGSDSVVGAAPWTIIWPECKAANKKITIRWPQISIPGLQKMRIFRADQPLALREVTDLSLPDSLVDSSGLICGQAYKYRFETEVLQNTAGFPIIKFISPEIEAKAISNQAPPPVRNFTASVVSGGIEVNGLPSPSASKYRLFRRNREGSVFSEIGNGFSTLPITDTSAEINSKAYCYQISFDDECGNRSLSSATICPVLLKAQQLDGSIDFNWSSMDGWQDGVAAYELIRKAAGQPEAIRYSGQDLIFTQQGPDKTAKRLLFQVKVTPNRSDLYPEPSYSNQVSIVQESRLKFPDAFTPNQDGINEVFESFGSFIKSYELIIYNSWGNVVFSSNRLEEHWDGKINGLDAQTGNYAYRAIATDEEGQRIEKSGFFALIR